MDIEKTYKRQDIPFDDPLFQEARKHVEAHEQPPILVIASRNGDRVAKLVLHGDKSLCFTTVHFLRATLGIDEVVVANDIWVSSSIDLDQYTYGSLDETNAISAMLVYHYSGNGLRVQGYQYHRAGSRVDWHKTPVFPSEGEISGDYPKTICGIMASQRNPLIEYLYEQHPSPIEYTLSALEKVSNGEAQVLPLKESE